jgi:hypothetical protein
VLTCTVLTFALCADPSVASAMTFGDLTVPIVWTRVATRSCMDFGAGASGEGGGYTQLETMWSTHETRTTGIYSGRLVVRLQNVSISMTAFVWPHMTKADTAAMLRGYRATLWHEIGHVRTAIASVAAANAGEEFSAPTGDAYLALAKARGDAALARINADQTDYDNAAEHGLRQSSLPPPLAGPNTIVNCPER